MPLDQQPSAPDHVALNVRKLERGDAAEWDRAHAVQMHIDCDALEYTGYEAGVMTYRAKRRRIE